jgi:hypothetical protein
MNLETVTIPTVGAREAAADYRREAKRTADPTARRELEQIARAYRIASADGVQLVALTPTVRAGGTVTRTRVLRRGRDDELRLNYLLPRLAIAPAEARFVYTLGVQRGGRVELCDQSNPWWNYRKGRVTIDAGFELPAGFEPGYELTAYGRQAWSAMVPLVPPKHRPARGLGGHHVFWEVDEWRWSMLPPPPRDPALLRHVGGDIYAVLATWELTELERLVLEGRQP